MNATASFFNALVGSAKCRRNKKWDCLLLCIWYCISSVGYRGSLSIAGSKYIEAYQGDLRFLAIHLLIILLGERPPRLGI